MAVICREIIEKAGLSLGFRIERMKSTDARERNITMLQLVAESMGTAREQVVFLGGTVIPFLLTEQVPLDLRLSKDVDFIFDYSSKRELFDFEDTLWERGFTKLKTGSVSQWTISGVTVDVLPTGPVLGFCNEWCDEAVQNAVRVDIGNDLTINMIPAPYFLGAKLSKFANRADNHATSRDIYDMLLVIAGRPKIETEVIGQASGELRTFLADELGEFLDKSDELGALLHLYSRDADKAGKCLSDVLARIRKIVDHKNRHS